MEMTGIEDLPDEQPQDLDDQDVEMLAGDESSSRDDDIRELGALLELATAQSNEEKRLKQARKRLVQIQRHSHPDQEAEQVALLSEINSLEERRVWHTIGCVALLYTQECTACGSKHSFFMGWFTVRAHATDKHLRDMKLGEPQEKLPHWVEREDRGKVAVCSNCCESQIAIDIAAGKYPEVSS